LKDGTLDRDLLKLDASDMLSKIGSLPGQLRAGMELARAAWAGLGGKKPAQLVIAGMGGSAIGAEILKSHVADRLGLPVVICRDDRLPGFVNRDSLVVVSSYSGNTREALACFDGALGAGAALGCVTSGGELLMRAERNSVSALVLPGGYPPRAAVGYSFAALLGLLVHTGMITFRDEELAECVEHLEGLCRIYSSPEAGRNAALLIARKLLGRIPLIYCTNRLGAVGLRWKNQFCENSKRLAFVGLLPEAMHNDIMGWEVDHKGIEPGVIFLRSGDEAAEPARVFAFMRDLVGTRGEFCGEFWGSGAGPLTQIFSLILLGDYASVYLALMRGLDPTPIRTIDELKARLKDDETEA
jgi:glucose/mannose-6-phosphate isomerase